MLNESILSLSFNQMKEFLIKDLTIIHIATIYILMYVLYKSLGRYIYFKPQEHSSKINRTFLTVSLLIFLIHILNNFTEYLPFLNEYRWFFVLCALVFFIAPFRIITHMIIWKNDNSGFQEYRDFIGKYLKIKPDYYKQLVRKNESVSRSYGSDITSWEEEAVKSTDKNISSDAFLDISALIVFITINFIWTYDSSNTYGFISYIFFGFSSLPIALLFINNSLFSWISLIDTKLLKYYKFIIDIIIKNK